MAYLPNIPQSTDIIASSQPDILGNFQYIQTTMQVDHTWNSNPITDGTHTKVSLPNQLSDITGALPAGIADIVYAIGGNLYAWNGTSKIPISAVASVTTATVAGTSIPITTLPNDCIGVAIGPPSSGSTYLSTVFMVISGTASYAAPIAGNRIGISGLTLTAFGAYTGTFSFKYIYWPI